MNETRFLVQVICSTYNHVNYINDTMNGFVMQQTSFPFVCIIVDDASTDGEPDVIKKYLDDNFDKREIGLTTEDETDEYIRIYAQHKENKNCYFCVLLLKYNHYSLRKPKTSNLVEFTKAIKYVALCEGDDYWTDPLKLQKQVKFLEEQEDYSMCFHAAEVKYEGGGDSPSRNGTNFSSFEDREYTSTELVSKWMVPTASIVYRRELVEHYQIKHPEWLSFGDIVLALKCSHTGKVYGMRDVMSMYRIHPNSVTNNAEFVDKTVFKLPDHYRCLRMNFPKVEKGPLEWSISHSYYVRMKRQSNLFKKFRDFVLFVWWDPRQAFRRIRKIIARKKE